MGAFGQLLIKSLGGNLDLYNGTGHYAPKKIEKTKSEVKKEIIEADNYHLETLKGYANNVIDRGNMMIKQITNDEYMHKVILTEKKWNEFIKWREDFLNSIK